MSLPLPDFELAPPEAIDPQALIRDAKDDVGALMLGLALAYNDLKDVDYVVYQLSQLVSKAQADTVARQGQFGGMQHHAARVLCGIAHEILNLLSKSRGVIESKEFQSYLAPLNASYKGDWQRIWDAARVVDLPDPQDKLSHLLMVARNTLAFHYGAKALRQGYSAHFGSTREHATKAVISVGDSMEGTRFYFADAAATTYVQDVLRMDYKQLRAVCQRLNRVLYVVLRQFVDARAPVREPYNP